MNYKIWSRTEWGLLNLLMYIIRSARVLFPSGENGKRLEFCRFASTLFLFISPLDKVSLQLATDPKAAAKRKLQKHMLKKDSRKRKNQAFA